MAVQFVNRIPQVKQDIRVTLANGLNAAAENWVSLAQDLAPVDTGFLKNSIGQTVTATPESLMAEIRSLAPYSGFVNWGTSKMAARPFWTVAQVVTKRSFVGLLVSRVGSAGRGVIRAALTEYHGVMGRKGEGF